MRWPAEILSKAFPFLGLFFYASLFPEVMSSFQLPVLLFWGVSCKFVDTSWKQKGVWRTVVFCTSFFHACFLPGTNLHDGLWHSVNINARRHRITLTLDNNAATASHATTVSRIYSGNSYYFGGRLFQTDSGQGFMMQIFRCSPLRSPQVQKML